MVEKSREKTAPEQGLFSGQPHYMPFNSALVARTGEILSAAATDIWAAEIELLRLEAEQASRSFLPVRGNGDGQNDGVEKWRDGVEQIIAQMRTVGDSMRQCGWRLFELYSQNALQKLSARPG